MPLINLQTNLKDLSYGEFGGNITSTNNPLVIKDINKNPTSSGINLEATKRVDDLKRIGKLLTSTPSALKFGGNQALLHTLEQRIKSNKKGKLAGDILRGAGNAIKTLTSTLAQVPVNGTGTHFVKGFSGKLGYLPGVQGHVEYKNNRNQDGIIRTTGILEKSGGNIVNPGDIFDPDLKSNIVIDYYSKQPNDKTRRENFVEEIGKKTVLSRTGSFNFNSGSYYTFGTGSVTDPKGSNIIFGGSIDKASKSGYVTSNSYEKDNITSIEPFTSSLSDAAEKESELDAQFTDLIKFRFKIITPPTAPNTDTEVQEPLITHLFFRAYLDAFSDNYGASWDSFNYIGRAEEFHTYTGFNRDMSFSFKVPALSKNELIPMYNKLNALAGHLAPTYVGSSFMRGNLIAITIGDYVTNQLGFIDSVNLGWDTDYPFGPGQNDEGGEVPHILDVSCNFKPIHSFISTFGETYMFNQDPTSKILK